MSIEAKLCHGMGYEYCVLFSRARVAIARAIQQFYSDSLIFIPSNVCPALPHAIGQNCRFMPVSAETGLAKRTGVQLYGYRLNECSAFEIDPLMTGWGQQRKAGASIISFGYSKTIDIGEGGAYLTDSQLEFAKLRHLSDWPDELDESLENEIDHLPENIARRRERAALWDKHLGDCCIKPPLEQVIPWRVIRRIPEKRDDVVVALRAAGFDAGTNYPPLPGVTDPSAVQWGKEVINLWVTDDYDELRIKAACEIIKRTIDGIKYDENDILSVEPYRVVRQL